MNRICILCNIKKDKNNYLKDRTVCKSCYKWNRRKNNKKNPLIQNQQPKNDDNIINDNNTSVSAYEKYRKVIIGTSNVGKTYCMVKNT